MCAAHGFTNGLDLLLAAGANVNMRNDEGKHALFFAVNTNSKKADNSRVKAVNRLIEAGADVNIKNKWGQTALLCTSDCRMSGHVTGSRSQCER